MLHKNVYAVAGIFIIVVSCSSPKYDDDILVDGSEIPPLSAAAVKNPYPDNPEIVQVSVNNNQGLAEQGDYKNGLRNGVWTEYHANNYPKTITGYVSGKKQGLWLSLDNRGQLLEKAYYHNDKLHGSFIKYNRSRIKEERNYGNNQLEGALKKYYDNGNLMEESNYKNGKLDGTAKWYDQEGNVTIEYEYKDGEWLNPEEGND